MAKDNFSVYVSNSLYVYVVGVAAGTPTPKNLIGPYEVFIALFVCFED